MPQAKLSILSAAVIAAITIGVQNVQANSVITQQWNDASVPDANLSSDFTEITDSYDNMITLFVFGNATGQIDNLNVSQNSVLKEGTNGTQLMVVRIQEGQVTFGGTSMTVTGKTNFTGGGDNQLTGIYLQPDMSSDNPKPSAVADVDITAETLTIELQSQHTNGKSVYGIASYGGTLDISSKVVNITLESNTERDVESQYSEVAGIVMASFGGKYEETYGSMDVSKDTTINIKVHSNSEKATSDSIKDDKVNNDRGGGSPVYGLKVEGGKASIEGVLNIESTAVGANAYGVKVTNEFYNSTLETVDDAASAKLTTVNITTSSKTGNAHGIYVERTDATDDNEVLLEVDGTTDISVTTETGTAQGIVVTGKTDTEMNGNVSVLATATTGTAQAIYINKEGGLNLNGAQNSITGNVLAQESGTLRFGQNTETVINGSIAVDVTSKVDLNGTVELVEGNTAKIDGNLNSTGGTFVLNEVSSDGSDILSIANATGDLTVAASGSLNDQFSSAEEAAKAMKESVSVTVGKDSKMQFTGKSSAIADGWTADANGKVTKVTENESLNAFENFNAMTLVAWRGENNHLVQRLGDIRDNVGAVGAWARVYGYDSKFSDVVSIKYKSNAIQAGTDFRFSDNYVAGVAFSYTDGEGEFSNGSADIESYTLAAYLTGFFPCGGYFDVIGRVGRLSTDIVAANQTNVMKASYDNTALGLSAELGYRYDINTMFYIEPQAELSYAVALGDDFTASNGLKVEQDDYQSLVGRLGARIGANFADNKGSVYMTASVNHDFLGDADSTAKLGNIVKDQNVDAGGTWVSYGIGAQFNTSANLNFYGSLEKSSGSEYREDYRYNIGLRYVW